MEVDEDKIVYRSDGHFYNYPESDLFSDQASAELRAVAIAAERSAEEAKRFLLKDKDTKTWAQNVSYHRQGLRDAEKQVAYHAAKLDVAKKHVKEEKANG
jgi:hypothetical protein